MCCHMVATTENNMLSLNYILIGTLPKKERIYLEENLKRDGFMSVRSFESSTLPVEDGILVSGDAGELRRAKERGMAALGYIGDTERRLEDRCTEEQQAETRVEGQQADMYAEGLEEVDFRFLTRVWQRCHHLPWTILTTERCVVKEFSMDYLDALFELYAGEGMTDYIAPLYPYEQEREYQQSYIECMYGFYGYGMWIVCDRKTGQLIGRAGVECREELNGEPELGYVIGVPYQRKGYATEVCTAILDYAREELSLPFVNCLIEEGNLVSEHVAGRLGFAYEETLLVDGNRMKKYRYRLF